MVSGVKEGSRADCFGRFDGSSVVPGCSEREPTVEPAAPLGAGKAGQRIYNCRSTIFDRRVTLSATLTGASVHCQAAIGWVRALGSDPNARQGDSGSRMGRIRTGSGRLTELLDRIRTARRRRDPATMGRTRWSVRAGAGGFSAEQCVLPEPMGPVAELRLHLNTPERRDLSTIEE